MMIIDQYVDSHFDVWIRVSIGIHGCQSSTPHHPDCELLLLGIEAQIEEDATPFLGICLVLFFILKEDGERIDYLPILLISQFACAPSRC